MERFYFTFGTDDKFPYQGGCVEVIASNKAKAIELFCEKYPRRESGFVNCSDIYNEEQWNEAVSHLREVNKLYGSKNFEHCWDVIDERPYGIRVISEHLKLVEEYYKLPNNVETPEAYAPIAKRKEEIIERVNKLKEIERNLGYEL